VGRSCGSKPVEEPFGSGELFVRDLVLFEKLLDGEPPAPGTLQMRAGELIRKRKGWMPEAHHAIKDRC
jgi:hypothetical protein